MDELVYQVTRDTTEWEEEEHGAPIISVWPAETEVVRDEEVTLLNPLGFWTARSHTEHPLFEFTIEEFEENFGLNAPEPDTKIWIATYCKWEKVNFDAPNA